MIFCELSSFLSRDTVTSRIEVGQRNKHTSRISHCNTIVSCYNQYISLLGIVAVDQAISQGLPDGEERRKPDKKQGLTDKQRSERFSSDYTEQSVEEHIKEYTMKYIDKAIEMVKYAIKRGIHFDYLLLLCGVLCIDLLILYHSCHSSPKT